MSGACEGKGLDKAATWFTTAAAKYIVTGPPNHLFGGLAEEFFSSPIDAGDRALPVIEHKSVGKLIKYSL
ncbi:MAG TPA: hypothetical protein VN428_05815 [Bryobacteraceae bacterium]|nr:hypothetical protein [Bryobacteraceae bacterium]